MGKESDMPAAAKRLEWRVNMPDGTSRVLVSESRRRGKVYDIVGGFVLRIWSFIDKAWQLGKKEPRKVIHGVKVGLALSLVSLFYYLRPLYDDVGGNAMWAVMTVVVVFEYTVGATLSKCVNRTVATFLAGSLGIGVHWVANQSGQKLQPIILQASVFLLAAAATFSRFIPSIKARFDYGCTIFILTFSLVSVSGYRVDKLLDLAQQRLSTIALGTSICIFIAMLLCPVWAGDDLHRLITNNLEKLADSLEGCISDYLNADGDGDDDKDNDKASEKKLLGYKCVLNTKASEDAMANFAVWEPGHGRFNFRHPWKQYLKIGASMRACAYCIETLHGSINSSAQVGSAEYILKPVSEECRRVCSTCGKVLRDLSKLMKSTTKSSIQDILVHDMNSAVEALQLAFKTLIPPSSQSLTTQVEEAQKPSSDHLKQETKSALSDDDDHDLVYLMEIAQLSTVASLLVEIAARTEGVVKEVNQLANLAQFRGQSDKKMAKQSQSQHKEQNVQTH
ncbi:PREDICTED: aluminum-activated malate transporter 10-like [Ipomoea nil]|uniref:aluminum-activated malate transporter 10-like n=1 Tax=Ipomoea nil TaxID=35883 RepID=UPI000900AE1A|nr:PREDICTED: aluminum-activated malate transporter 10-like [Ipomoea nil]